MKAAVLFGPKDLRIVSDFNEPKLLNNSIKIKVEYCGICGSDIHKYLGHSSIRKVVYPVPLGHEISGTIIDIGNDVKGFSIGEIVTVDPNWSCGECDACKNNLPHLCFNSVGVVKGMAEYVCVPSSNVYKVPFGMSYIDAALAEPVSCCIHGIDKLDLKDKQNLIIIGFGAIGLMMINLLKEHNLNKIIVIDNNEEKRDIALNAGADFFVNSKNENIKELLDNNNVFVHRILECVGNEECIKLAINLASKGAKITLFGVPNIESILDFNLYNFFSKELTLNTAYLNPKTMNKAIEAINNGYITASKNVVKIINLDDLSNELNTMEYIKKGKVLVKIK